MFLSSDYYHYYMTQRGQKALEHYTLYDTAFYNTLLLGFHIYTPVGKYYSDTGNETLGKGRERGISFMTLAIEKRTN